MATTHARFVKVVTASVVAAAFAIAPVISAGTALADGDQDPGTTQELPPPPPKDDPDGHFWLD